MLDILEGRVNAAHFNPQKIKYRMITEGFLKEECYNCGFHERRVSALEQRFNEIEAGTGQAINELKEEKETLRTELSAMKDSLPFYRFESCPDYKRL